MGDIVNLNDRRKQKARAAKLSEATTNRVKFGRTRSQKNAEEKTRSADIRKLDGAKRQKDDAPKD